MDTEAQVALSDLVLALECFALSFRLFRRRHRLEAGAPHLAASLAALGVGTALGALWHGFFSERDLAQGFVIWKATLLSVGISGFALWHFAAARAPGGAWARACRAAAALQLVLYLVLITPFDAFLIASANLALPVTAELASSAIRLSKKTTRPDLLGAAGLSATLAAGAMQAAGIGAFGLDANTLFHLCLLASLPLIAASVRPG